MKSYKRINGPRSKIMCPRKSMAARFGYRPPLPGGQRSTDQVISEIISNVQWHELHLRALDRISIAHDDRLLALREHGSLVRTVSSLQVERLTSLVERITTVAEKQAGRIDTMERRLERVDPL